MTDLLLVLSFIAFLALGTLAPFLFSLSYVWVDIFLPHRVSDALLTNVPVALITGIAAFGSYLIMDRRAPPRLGLLFLLYLVLAVWITLSTFAWPVVPGPAEVKWDPSIKTRVFAAFIPVLFRSRVQIEAFLMVIIFSAAAHLLPWGVKTMVSGGGYGKQMGLLGSNATFLSESSVISAVCLAFIPLLLTLVRHNLLIPKGRLRQALFFGMAGLFALGAIGTFARTAIIGLAVLYAGMWWRAKRKVWFTVGAALALVVMGAFTSTQWTERISTTADFQTENSAATRLAVWKWTLGFVQDHPLGGGFNVFVTNKIVMDNPDPAGQPLVQFGRAFHSIYFAYLGEHGYVGLALFLSIVGLSYAALQSTRRLTRNIPEHAWCFELAGSLQIGLSVFLACAAFVDVSFHPLLWDQLALAVCLREYARRAVAPAPRRQSVTVDGPIRGGIAARAR